MLLNGMPTLLKPTAAAADAANITLGTAKQQMAAGYAKKLASLNAEQPYQQARINLLMAEANRYTDTAVLFQALGGGWWNQRAVDTRSSE
jgi:outer membrane protein TolC